MARKKRTNEELVAEITKLSAEETLTLTEWPKTTQGSHLTITEHKNGQIDMTWNWEQLNKDINNAIREYEHSQSSKVVVSEQSQKTGTKANRKKGSKNELV